MLRLLAVALAMLGLGACATMFEPTTINGGRWGYVRSGGTIKYQQPPSNGFWPGTAGEQLDMPAGVDAASFVLVGNGWPSWAKDKSRVYHERNVLVGADPATFERVGETPFARDRNSVWFYGEKLADADGPTFRVISVTREFYQWLDWFAADGASAYHNASRMQDVNASTFKEHGKQLTDDKSCWSLAGTREPCLEQ